MAGISQGLMALGGLGQGLSQGVDAFNQTRQGLLNEKKNDTAMGLLAAGKGYDYDPATGSVNPNQLGQANQAAQLSDAQARDLSSQQQMQAAKDDADPNSATFKAHNQVYGALGSYVRKQGKNGEYDDLADTLSDESISPRTKALLTDHPAMKQLLSGITTDASYKKVLDAIALKNEGATDKIDQKKSGLIDKDAQGVFKGIRGDKEWQKANGSATEAENLKNLIANATTNPAAANAIGVYAARFASGGQRINRQEMEQLGQGEKDIIGKTAQIAKQAATGTLTKANADYMRQFIDITSQEPTKQRNQIEDDFVSNFARRNKMDPDEAAQQILGHPTHATQAKQSTGLLQQASPGGPKPGMIEDGYRFKGGNPADKNSWEKI